MVGWVEVSPDMSGLDYPRSALADQRNQLDGMENGRDERLLAGETTFRTILFGAIGVRGTSRTSVNEPDGRRARLRIDWQ
jgi:hypothetical protein